MIDIHTLMLALAVGNIGFAVLMAGYTHGAAPSPGLRLWIVSRLVLGGTQLLGWMPVPYLAGIDAVGSVTGVALEVTAYSVFFGYERWKRVLS
ncbi:MAG TPA: GGDEF domain-containing protein, partial [Telluria sp.]|nr:GGDEF domain-containing protein [Telluria sp.]